MSQNILIIGGGLGGLALGQALKKAGVDFQIFERDEVSSFRAQGYRIRIDNEGGNALRQLLPFSLYQAFEVTSSKVVPGGHAIEAETGQEKSSIFSKMPPQKGSAWNVDRTVLRNILLSGLDEHIKFGKRFERFEHDEKGVVAHFADGSSVTGALLVGADGIWSRVRHQMLPKDTLLDTEGRAIFGKTEIENDLLDVLPASFQQGITLTSAHDNPHLRLFCDVMHFDRTTDELRSELRVPNDYMYWVLVFRRDHSDKPDIDLATISRNESAQLSEQMTSTWHPSIRRILNEQLPIAASTLFFFISKVPLEQWPINSKAILLGDAFHPMPPVGGVGANLAFQDAADLLKALLDGSRSRALIDYETLARQRSEQALQRAAGGAANFFGMKPIQELFPVEYCN